MLTKIMKLATIAILITLAILWKYATTYELLMRVVVSVSAIMVAAQGARAKKYSWVVAFCAVAVIFNPFIPTGVFSGTLALSVILGSAVLFAGSLFSLRTQPILSIPSITDRSPGSESL